jgi:glutathione synthase/RimK-type ligase-like ATP-grasp enzyme
VRGRREHILLAASEAGLGSQEAALIVEAAQSIGVSAEEVRWDQLERPDAPVLIRHTWDYHKRIAEFRGWLNSLTSVGAAVHNSVDLVRWNLDKGYLADLGEGGVLTPRTVYLAAGAPVPSAAELGSRVGSGRVVVKPTVSATSWRTRLVELEDHDQVVEAVAAAAEGGRAMVQEFLPTIEAGEWSVVYLGGVFSHAVLKRPKPGEFRVQIDFGGSAELLEAPLEVRAACDRCIDWLPEAPTFARVDGVVTDDAFVLMELELIEPDLFLRLHPPAAAQLVELVVE